MPEADSLLAELLARFQAAAAGDSTDLLLESLDPLEADELRLCAIPHEFDVAALQALVPGTAHRRAEERCRDLAELSVVAVVNGHLALHAPVRQRLFGEWLRPENLVRFTEASARLAAHYEQALGEAAGERRERLLHKRMFHLLGADQARGFAHFESLCRQARYDGRLSACSGLIRLLHEYDSVLEPERALWLAYHEGKLSSDLRDWDRAEALLQPITGSTGTGELRAKTFLRLGYIACQRRDFGRAVDLYRQALDLATSSAGGGVKVHEVQSALAEAYRDGGDRSSAEKLLLESLEGAAAAGDLAAAARVHNALGTLHRQRGETAAAAESYQRSLDYLQQVGDRFGAAQVYNNLGLTYADGQDMVLADEAFQRSLSIKREAGDSLGQARTLLNRVRILRARNDLAQAIELCLEAAQLFGELHEWHGQAEAQRVLGLLYETQGEIDLARAAFGEAAALFERAGGAKEAKELRSRLERLGCKVGIPWWAWLPVAAIVLFLVLILIAIVGS